MWSKKTYLENNLKNLKNLNGRLELIKNLSNEGKVYLDYAHTPDALKNSLLALKENIIKRLILFLDVVVREINKKEN